MVKRIFNTKVPFYAIVIFFVLVSGFAVFFILKYREVIYDYKLYLSSSETNTLNQFQYGSWPALSNTDFFGKIKNKFVSEKITFIEADLSAMKLRFYEDGEIQKEFNILAKGRVGSWWETPTGIYKVNEKVRTDFSSFAHVYSPWALAFQGNFLIHGWPYYPDGTPVATTYSGGCIRLATSDAKELYDVTNTGTPVLVYNTGGIIADDFKYQLKLPDISAKSYLVADLRNNFVFIENNKTATSSIASITKLVTAMVTVENINLDNKITVRADAIVLTSKPRFVVGESFSAYQLLFPLLMESSNEAAKAFSNYLGGRLFVFYMNAKAKSLGMNNTTFVDAAGSSLNNTSTPEDLFALIKNIYENRSFILNISAGKIATSAYGTPVFANLQNFNGFGGDPEFVGGKIGQNQDIETMAAVFNINFNGKIRPIVIIVLDSHDSIKDVKVIKDYIMSMYGNTAAPIIETQPVQQ